MPDSVSPLFRSNWLWRLNREETLWLEVTLIAPWIGLWPIPQNWVILLDIYPSASLHHTRRKKLRMPGMILWSDLRRQMNSVVCGKTEGRAVLLRMTPPFNSLLLIKTWQRGPGLICMTCTPLAVGLLAVPSNSYLLIPWYAIECDGFVLNWLNFQTKQAEAGTVA